jgi:glutaredoxin 2
VDLADLAVDLLEREDKTVVPEQMDWVEVLEEHLKDPLQDRVDLVVLLLLILSDHFFHKQY